MVLLSNTTVFYLKFVEKIIEW